MGDRYELSVKCTYCKELNGDIWYAPTCGATTFRCFKCKRLNFITSGFVAKKVKDLVFEDVLDAISSASNMMSEEQIKACAKEEFKKIKEGGK